MREEYSILKKREENVQTLTDALKQKEEAITKRQQDLALREQKAKELKLKLSHTLSSGLYSSIEN